MNRDLGRCEEQADVTISEQHPLSNIFLDKAIFLSNGWKNAEGETLPGLPDSFPLLYRST